MQGLRTAASGLAAAMLAGTLFGAGPAAASGPLTVIDFTGTCSDCAGTGVGVLTVQNFGTGVLNDSNFVSWTYTSNLVTYSLTQASFHAFSADFSAGLPGLAAVSIETATTVPPVSSDGAYHDFMSSLTANPFTGSDWTVDGFIPAPGGVELPVSGGGVINDDQGPSYTWRVEGSVPEPATWALMIAGFGLAGAALRRERRRAVAPV